MSIFIWSLDSEKKTQENSDPMLSIAIIYGHNNSIDFDAKKLAELFCMHGYKDFKRVRVSIYTSTSNGKNILETQLPKQSTSDFCSETEFVHRPIDCSNVGGTEIINNCLSISAYYDWNDYFLVLKREMIGSPHFNLSKIVSEIQSNPVQDVGILVIRLPKSETTKREDPIFFHRNHITILGKPFGTNERNWECAIEWLKELYSKTTRISFYKELVVGSYESAKQEISCKSDIRDSIKDLLLRYLIYLVDKDSYSKDRESKKLIISMSLYGTQERYVCDAIRNAQLWPMIYPSWKLRYYIPATSISQSIPRPPKKILFLLEKLGVQLVEVEDTVIGPMLWRFKVLQDEQVDRFIVRDIDDHLSIRDSLCVDHWMQSGKVLQCVRDHPNHSSYPLSGGMFGARRKELKHLCGHATSYEEMRRFGAEYMKDMNYLNSRIWPCVPKTEVDCCDEYSWWRWPGAHPFPLANRDPGYFVGSVFFSKCYIPQD